MSNENEIVEDLKNWKEIIKPYATPESKLAKTQIYNTFLPFVMLLIAAAIIYEYSIWATVFVSFVAGLFLTRVFIIQHDCGHQSFFPDRKLNDTMGFISSLVTCIPYKYWARSHNHHQCTPRSVRHQNHRRCYATYRKRISRTYQLGEIEIQNIPFCTCDVYYWTSLLHFYSQQNSFYQI